MYALFTLGSPRRLGEVLREQWLLSGQAALSSIHIEEAPVPDDPEELLSNLEKLREFRRPGYSGSWAFEQHGGKPTNFRSATLLLPAGSHSP